MAAFAWFYKMVSFPNQDKLSKTSRFTLWTALLAYGGGGLALVCVPSLWGQFLEFHVSRILEGYLRLSGIHLVALSFIYIIIAREGSFSSKNGPVLSSICERLILVNGILLLFLLKDFFTFVFRPSIYSHGFNFVGINSLHMVKGNSVSIFESVF